MTDNKRRRSRTSRHRRQPLTRRHRIILQWIGISLLVIAVGPVVMILLLRWIPVPTTAFMLRHKFRGENPEYQWVPGSGISPAALIAVVASEDQNFPSHWGFDFKAISRALEERGERGRLRGASTISQQTAKNLFLWPGRSWLRKGLEACLTMVIELCWPKQRILEVYLNIAQFGPEVYGIAAASKAFFNTSPSRLTGEQAALLAAVLPNPIYRRLLPPSAYLQERAAHIRRQVKLLGGPAYLR